MPEAIGKKKRKKKKGSHQKLMPCCSYGAFVLKIKNMNLLGIFFYKCKMVVVFLLFVSFCHF